MTAALAATLDPARFERHSEACAHGIFSDGARNHTRVVDGACIFLNRPGFAGGSGCALAPCGHRGWRATDRLEALGVLAAAHQGGLGAGCRTTPRWQRCGVGRGATGASRARKWPGAAQRVRWPTWPRVPWSTRWEQRWRRSRAQRFISSFAVGSKQSRSPVGTDCLGPLICAPRHGSQLRRSRRRWRGPRVRGRPSRRGTRWSCTGWASWRRAPGTPHRRGVCSRSR